MKGTLFSVYACGINLHFTSSLTTSKFHCYYNTLLVKAKGGQGGKAVKLAPHLSICQPIELHIDIVISELYGNVLCKCMHLKI